MAKASPRNGRLTTLVVGAVLSAVVASVTSVWATNREHLRVIQNHGERIKACETGLGFVQSGLEGRLDRIEVKLDEIDRLLRER